MRLSPTDYKSLIAHRCENIRSELWDNSPRAIVQVQEGEQVPDFDEIRHNIGQMQELVEEYERSIGPA